MGCIGMFKGHKKFSDAANYAELKEIGVHDTKHLTEDIDKMDLAETICKTLKVLEENNYMDKATAFKGVKDILDKAKESINVIGKEGLNKAVNQSRTELENHMKGDLSSMLESPIQFASIQEKENSEEATKTMNDLGNIPASFAYYTNTEYKVFLELILAALEHKDTVKEFVNIAKFLSEIQESANVNLSIGKAEEIQKFRKVYIDNRNNLIKLYQTLEAPQIQGPSQGQNQGPNQNLGKNKEEDQHKNEEEDQNKNENKDLGKNKEEDEDKNENEDLGKNKEEDEDKNEDEDEDKNKDEDEDKNKDEDEDKNKDEDQGNK